MSNIIQCGSEQSSYYCSSLIGEICLHLPVRIKAAHLVMFPLPGSMLWLKTFQSQDCCICWAHNNLFDFKFICVTLKPGATNVVTCRVSAWERRWIQAVFRGCFLIQERTQHDCLSHVWTWNTHVMVNLEHFQLIHVLKWKCYSGCYGNK